MKYERTPSFDSDWKSLSEEERVRFRSCILKEFNPACDRLVVNPASRFPTKLRVKDVDGAPGVFEMTWSISGPDGRATFEWVTIDGERAIRWRRVGGHSVFGRP